MKHARRHQRCFAAVGLLGCAVYGGCGPEASRPLVLVVSGDTQGWIVPCGCISNQSGGLPRRAACIEELRAEAEAIVADAGGAPGGTSLYDRLKFEAVLRGEIAMGVAAHNIGRGEALLGPEYLRQTAAELGLPLVSANVCDAQDRPVAEPLRIVAAGGRRVALVGVLSPRYATPRLRVTPPRQAVLDALRAAGAKQKWDAVVVLAYVPEEELLQLAESLPEADLIVGGPTGHALPPKNVAGRLVASATHQGKFLACFDLPPSGSAERWSGRIIELDERFADDPGQTANVARFRAELSRRDLGPADTAFAPSPGGASHRVAGTKSCAKCHADDQRAWKASKHAHAWEVLAAKGAHADPDCQRCHTTGYGLPGGFASVKSGAVVDVGCESCHGPSLAHAEKTKTRTPFYGRAKDICLGCHDRENSPKFDYDQYWAKIRHGESPATEQTP